MSGGKETPRQKMIGMMYLVLLALLAMNVSKQIINAFVTLNNKMEKSLDQVENSNAGIALEFEAALTTLNSAQKKNPKEIQRVEDLLNKNKTARDLTKRAANGLIILNEHILLESTFGKGATRDNLKGKKDGHGHDLHYTHKDKFGYYHLNDLSHFEKKDDFDTPTRLFVGPDFTNIADDGQKLLDIITHYRDSLCMLVANHPSKPIGKEGKIIDYNFDPKLIIQPKFKTTAQEMNEFDSIVQIMLNQQVKDKKISYADSKVLKAIIVRLTIPKVVINHDEEYPWIAGMFDHSPMVAASAVLTSLRSDIISVETIVSQYFAKDINVVPFAFNKIEPLAFSSTSYINQGDSLTLKVMIAAYDSSKTTELKYWVDDTVQYLVPEATRDTSLMLRYLKKPTDFGKELNLGGGVGDHIIAGLVAVESATEGKKWKPWRFKYSVGAPNAAISAADLQVLYRNWKNKIKVSASGYNPEKVKVSCSGCSISSAPDKDGNYTATVGGGRAKTAQIKVSAIDDNGKSVELANETFRIFPLPKPTPYFGGKAGGTLKKVDAVSIPKLVAKLGESPLDVPYSVVEFMLFTTKDGAPVRIRAKGSRVTNEMKNAIKRIPKGGNLTFAEIKVKGPGGKVSTLEGGLVLRLN